MPLLERLQVMKGVEGCPYSKVLMGIALLSLKISREETQD